MADALHKLILVEALQIEYKLKKKYRLGYCKSISKTLFLGIRTFFVKIPNFIARA